MNNPTLTALALLATALAAPADVFVSSFSQHIVYRYNELTGAPIDGGTFIAAGSGGLSAPHRGLFGPDGNFYVASANNDSILRYNGANGAFLNAFVPMGSGGLNYPVDLIFRGDGYLYVSSQLDSTVKRFNATTGVFYDDFVSTGSGGLDRPSGMVFGLNGDLYVTGRMSDAVYEYSGINGDFVRTFGGGGTLDSPYGIDVGSDGTLYVADGAHNRVVHFTADGSFLGIVPPSGGVSALPSGPIGVEFGPGGDLYVANINAGSIRRYDGTTGLAEPDLVAAGSAGLAQPNFFTFAVPEPGSALLLAAGTLVFARRPR